MAKRSGAKPKSPRARNRSSSNHFAIAQSRILQAIQDGSSELDLSDLNNLEELPAAIGNFIHLRNLSIKDTKVSDITLIAMLTALRTLRLDNTRVSDLSPIAHLPTLETLDFDHTLVRDISPVARLTTLNRLSLDRTLVTDLAPIARLTGLQTVSMIGTEISDLTPLAGLTNLETLWLGVTPIDDITPLAALTNLQALAIDDTAVKDISLVQNFRSLRRLSVKGSEVLDLSPIAMLTGLQDAAAADFKPTTEGFYFERSFAARLAPFDALVQLEQPAHTVETINEVRRQLGLSEHFPKDYERPKNFLSSPNVNTDTEKEEQADPDREQLTQKPASHSFLFRAGRIEAQPQAFPPRHPDVASDIRKEVSEKARETSVRLTTCNAPRRMIATISRLEMTLGQSLENVRAGILQMRFRSLEADLAAYDTEDGRKEIPEDALAMLRDLASSVEDLMGCFPQLADVEAERLAQRLKEVDVPKIVDVLSQIRAVASQSDGVAPSAIEALEAGVPELIHDAEIINSGASEAAKVAASNARDRTVGYMLLVYRNFIAGAANVGKELAGLGSETWKDFRAKAPPQFADAGVALTIAALVNALLGPAAAMGAFALSFKPLHDRAKKIVDKLTSIAKRTKSDSKDSIEQ